MFYIVLTVICVNIWNTGTTRDLSLENKLSHFGELSALLQVLLHYQPLKVTNAVITNIPDILLFLSIRET